MTELPIISAENATSLASFGTLIRFEIIYIEDQLNVRIGFNDRGKNFGDVDMLFEGVRQLEFGLGNAIPWTEEVEITSVKRNQLENLHFHVVSSAGSLRFNFFCKLTRKRQQPPFSTPLTGHRCLYVRGQHGHGALPV